MTPQLDLFPEPAPAPPPGCRETMPRLSVSLTGRRHPLICQNCRSPAGADDCWREHDQQDRPEQTFLYLCEPCAKKLIQPHPRLYSQQHRWAPRPGAMPVCLDCPHRRELSCSHWALKANGGPGLILRMPQPTTMHVDYTVKGRRVGEWFKNYHGPVDCEGKGGKGET